MSKRKKRPICRLCKERPAKVLIARHHDGREYVHGVTDPVFCSKRCAANYALTRCDEDGTHWCEPAGEWVYCERQECYDCGERESET